MTETPETPIATTKARCVGRGESAFIDDLCDCQDAWTEYAEARFGKPEEVWLTPEQLKERFGINSDGRYAQYRYMETAPGWSEAHEHFTVGFMYARGHRLDTTTGNWHSWVPNPVTE